VSFLEKKTLTCVAHFIEQLLRSFVFSGIHNRPKQRGYAEKYRAAHMLMSAVISPSFVV
jgi:hypothetical protein